MNSIQEIKRRIQRVTIEYEHGGSRVVNVSMDSGVAMIRGIMRACE